MDEKIILDEKPIELPKANMLGYCSACGVKIIEAKIVDKRKASLRKMENFREHIIELSNGTIMRVAVCDSCKVALIAGKSMEKANEILDNHIIYWEKKIPTAPADFASLTVTNSNTDLKTFLIEKEATKEELINLNEIKL